MPETSDITATLLDLLKRFMAMAEERAKTLPYRINIIDTLGGAYETENSKILAAFLRYRSPAGHFEILESLLDYIQSRFDAFHDIKDKVDRPSINTEHRHIDVYVREALKYAIIMENKSNWAGDQYQQLSRYIGTAISEGFSENQIYVLYLPPQEETDPKDHSWGEYKESFKDRYVKLSWRDDILPWMKEEVLPNVRRKDVPLSSALEQYIDYWQGRFGLIGVNNEEKMKMREAVLEGLALGLEQDAGRSLEIIRDAYVNSQALTGTLRDLADEKKRDIELSFWNDLIADLRMRGYDKIDLINLSEEGILRNYRAARKENYTKDKYYRVGICIRFLANGRPFCFECWTQITGYYGFKFMDETGKDQQNCRHPTLSGQSQRIEQIVKEVLPRCNQWPAWYGCASDSDLDFRNMWYKTVVEKLGTDDKCKSFAQQWASRFDDFIRTFKNRLIDTNTETPPEEPQP